MDIKQQFGETIRALRKQKNLTQEDLGERTGLHITYIGSVERGERNISLDNINKICQALDISMADVFSIMEQPPTLKEDFLSYMVQIPPSDQDFFRTIVNLLLEWKEKT